MLTSSLPRLIAVSVLVALAASAGVNTPVQAQATMQVIASGLDNPRKLAFGPDGALYVAEAGRGGLSSLCSIDPGTGANRCYGPTGAITRITGIGIQQRVLTGLPSIAPADGNNAAGPNDIGFGFASAWVLVGYAGNPANRGAFEAAGIRLGSLIHVQFTGAWAYVLDVSAHEFTNPEGTNIDSNPFALQLASDGALVADAGGNSLIKIATTGQMSTLAVFPRRTIDLPGGGTATIDAVPTTVIDAPDGNYYVGELTGFPFVVGAARVYRVRPTGGTPEVVAAGFTNIIDLAIDRRNGAAYVLEHDADGIPPPTGPGVNGRVVRVNADGSHTTIASAGLVKPGGITVGPDGALYVTTRTNFAGLGEVVRIVP
jgi:hypothetical protein